MPPPPSAARRRRRGGVDRVHVGSRARFYERAAGRRGDARDGAQRLDAFERSPSAWCRRRRLDRARSSAGIRLLSTLTVYVSGASVRKLKCPAASVVAVADCDGLVTVIRAPAMGAEVSASTNGSAQTTRHTCQCPCFLTRECNEENDRGAEATQRSANHFVPPNSGGTAFLLPPMSLLEADLMIRAPRRGRARGTAFGSASMAGASGASCSRAIAADRLARSRRDRTRLRARTRPHRRSTPRRSPESSPRSPALPRRRRRDRRPVAGHIVEARANQNQFGRTARATRRQQHTSRSRRTLRSKCPRREAAR